MIAIQQDPNDATKLIVTATVTLYLDRLMVETLNAEIAEQITDRARKDLTKNRQVKKVIAEAAQHKLLELLGVPATPRGDANGSR